MTRPCLLFYDKTFMWIREDIVLELVGLDICIFYPNKQNDNLYTIKYKRFPNHVVYDI